MRSAFTTRVNLGHDAPGTSGNGPTNKLGVKPRRKPEADHFRVSIRFHLLRPKDRRDASTFERGPEQTCSYESSGSEISYRLIVGHMPRCSAGAFVIWGFHCTRQAGLRAGDSGSSGNAPACKQQRRAL